MFNWKKLRGSKPKRRSLDELKRDLRTLDADDLRRLKGGKGVKRDQLVVRPCGGWLPQ